MPFAFFLRSLFASGFVRVLSRSLFSSGPGFSRSAVAYRNSALPFCSVASGIACTYDVGISIYSGVGVGTGGSLVVGILVSIVVATVASFGSLVCFVFFFCLFAFLDYPLNSIASYILACRCLILFCFFTALLSSFFAALA